MDSREHIDMVNRYCAHNYEPLPVVISKGEGVYVEDVDGKKYIDMLSAYSAVSHGHRNPRILKALRDQCDRITLTSRAFHNDTLGPFLEKLCGVTGFEKALPMNTGAEAVETALKAIRKWAYEVKGVPDGKARIIAAENNFHGRTLGVISFATKGDSRTHFGPFLPGVDTVPFNDVEAIEKAITDETAGVLLEPIQGEGGVIVPDNDYFPRVREICSRNNVLLCLDEIQTGLARTGRMFCFEHYGIRPDVLTVGKALGGGVYPVSAACADSAVLDVFTPGTHGSTFGGNPLAAAVAGAALDILVEDDLAGHASEMGDYFMAELRGLAIDGVVEVRGKGLLIGMEFDTDCAHDKALALLDAGLLAKDTRPNTIRFAPPLIITKEQIDEAMTIIKSVF
ncbi:MAG TPA: ornithine--oxo-acid transaminase [bacterium]|nr:ornithine--oxo-acid transaminase [bacterium]